MTLLSTSSLMLGVAAAAAGPAQIILTGVAGLVAGAMSMAAGEFVSVSSQADSEAADSERVRLELEADPDYGCRELAATYVRRRLPKVLADKVVQVSPKQSALEAHLRDELGIIEH